MSIRLPSSSVVLWLAFFGACPHEDRSPRDATPIPRPPSSRADAGRAPTPDAATPSTPPPVATSSAPNGPQPPTLPAPAAGAPDLAALQAMLARHTSRRFDAAARDRGCPADQTLGEYVAMLVHNGGLGDAPGDLHQLGGVCVDAIAEADRIAIDAPADPAYWHCRIDAWTSDPEGESPWHYELRLRVRRANRTPDLATLSCPGAP